MTMPRNFERECLAGQIAAISNLPRKALVEGWTMAYGHPPPKGISRRLLEYAAAYQEQTKAFGGLKPATKRKLRRIANTPADGGPLPNQYDRQMKLPPGSRLVREWHGRSHTVEVLDAGFLCDGRHYGSLSEVARTITGARWSGPRFFGI